MTGPDGQHVDHRIGGYSPSSFMVVANTLPTDTGRTSFLRSPWPKRSKPSAVSAAYSAVLPSPTPPSKR